MKWCEETRSVISISFIPTLRLSYPYQNVEDNEFIIPYILAFGTNYIDIMSLILSRYIHDPSVVRKIF